MISLNSTLTNKLKLKNTNSFWVAKLYYNDESAFVGISDTHRVDGSDIYYGLVTDWGVFNQLINYFDFSTSVGNVSIKLVNTFNSFQGGRFSDALSSKNFANRKFELFQCVDGLTLDTSANQIAKGIISGDFTYNRNEVTLSLIDDSFNQHKQIPKTLVTTSSYANAPTKNVGKPIPIAYGDFHARTDVGTIDSYFDSHYHKGQFPAIITNKWDDSNNVVVATPDSQALHTLDADYVFNHHQEFGAFHAANVAVASGTPYIRVSGSLFNFYPKLLNGGALADDNFNSGLTLTASSNAVTAQFDIPKLKRLGVISNIYIIVKYYNSGSGTFGGETPDDWKLRKASPTTSNIDLAWNPTDDHQTVSCSSIFTTAEKESWSMEGTLEFYLNNASGTSTAIIGQADLEFHYHAEQDYTQYLNSIKTISSSPSFFFFNQRERRSVLPKEVTEITTEVIEPSAVDYVYYSGKGRKFGSWTDDSSRNNGYDEADLIENPIYIIEDILRTELSVSSIDTTAFDVSGNATNGLITDVFDDAVTDVKFSFSQFKLIDSKDLIEEVGRLCGTYVFLSGDGNFKTVTLRKPADYDSDDVVQTIDYNLITLDVINKTPTSGVRNDVDVNYGYHYAESQTTSTINSADSTSKGTTVNGINQTLKLKLEAGKILDSTTATALAAYYKDISKDQKIEIMFDVPTAIYNGLEIGDLINFSNWDSNIKLYGSAMDQANNIFIITQTNKRPNGCEFFCTEVSD